MLRSTLMLSKLGALDSAQATEYLTSILNGFNMEASQSEDVVNKLVSVDNIAATSAGKILPEHMATCGHLSEDNYIG